MEIFLLAAWLIWPPLSWRLWRRTRYRRVHWLFVLPFVALVGFLLIFMSMVITDAKETTTMIRYDTDGDGGFSGDELTPEASRALEAYTSDAPRTLAWMLILPVTLAWVGIVYAAGLAFKRAPP